MKTHQIFSEPMPSKTVAVVWSLLAISVQLSFSRPLQEFSKSRTIRSTPIFEDVQGYLTKFGYLPESDLETGSLRTEDQLHDALRTLQTFGNIPITGRMDAATKELLRKPRCGLPDVTPGQNRRKRRYTLQGQKWHHTNLTWSLRTRHLERIDHGWVRSDLHKAFQVWSRHSKLTFREVNSESADILVFFEKGYHGDGFPFDGPGQVLAHAFFPGSGRGGDAHFDEDEEWLLNGKETSEGTSLFMVAAHEFGHSLGLSHSSVQGALMFPWYQGHLRYDSELPDDDRFGIQILYGSKDDRIWGNIPAYRPSLEHPTTTTTRTTTTTTTTTAATTTTSRTTTRDPVTNSVTITPRVTVTSSTARTRSPNVRIIPAVDDKPDHCNTSFDAVSIIRKDTFFFKGKYTWRLGVKNGLYPGYPALISRLWYDLPENMTHVDAVYEKQDGKIVFFIGRRFYLFNGNILVPGYPKPLTALGLPEELDHVDAATVWGHNSKTYIFSGTMYWRYDDETERMELDYPRDMAIWRGVEPDINAAFQWHDGVTYFFKGRDFWKFNDLRMRVDRVDPRPVGPFWFNCSSAADGDGGDRRPNTGGNKGRVTVVKGKTNGRAGGWPTESGDDNQTPNSSAVPVRGGPPLLALLPIAVVFLRRRRSS